MANFTTNYNLVKPDETENYDINVQNNNMDIIDTEITKIDDKLESQKADYVANNAFSTTTGTSTAYEVTLDPSPIEYKEGMNITIVPHTDCGENPTLNINNLGETPLLNNEGETLSAGDLKANKPYSFVRVGNNFFLSSSGGSKINGVIKEYMVSVGENISAGDFVKFIDGFDLETNTQTSINNTISLFITASTLSNNRVFIAYSTYEYGSSQVKAIILTINNNNTITRGTETIIDTTHSSLYIDSVKLRDDRIVIAYADDNDRLYSRLISIDKKNNISPFESVVINSNGMSRYINLLLLSENRVFITSNNNSTNRIMLILTINDENIISANTIYQINNSSTQTAGLVLLSNNRVLLTYVNNEYKLSTIILKINDDNTIVKGVEVIINDKNSIYLSTVLVKNNKVVVSYVSSYVHVIVLTIIDNVINIETETLIDRYNPLYLKSVKLDDDRIVLTHLDYSSKYASSTIVMLSSSNISIESDKRIFNRTYSYYPCAKLFNDERMIACFISDKLGFISLIDYRNKLKVSKNKLEIHGVSKQSGVEGEKIKVITL